MLGQHLVGREGAVGVMAPIATTPWPSRNRSGSTPVKVTGIEAWPSVTRNEVVGVSVPAATRGGDRADLDDAAEAEAHARAPGLWRAPDAG